jgi:hypothetical protein
MASGGTQGLIEQGIRRFQEEVPALGSLKLVFELELRGNRDTQMFQVELPGPKISKGVADHARVTVEIQRSTFNELVTEGHVTDYISAFERGLIKATGDPNVLKLIAQVVERHEQRVHTKKVH